jgi:hypothetical protein
MPAAPSVAPMHMPAPPPSARPPAPRGRGEQGQASVELVVLLPLIAVLGLALWQAVVAGQAAWLAGAAARSGARAEALGGDPADAARRVLPGSLEHGLRVHARRDGGVDVQVGVPAVLGGGRIIHVAAGARLERQG